MVRVSRLITAVVCSLLSAFAFVGDLVVAAIRDDYPTAFDAPTSLDADQVQRTARAEVAMDGSGTAGAMFSERVRSHDRFIGDGFTNMGVALPI